MDATRRHPGMVALSELVRACQSGRLGGVASAGCSGNVKMARHEGGVGRAGAPIRDDMAHKV